MVTAVQVSTDTFSISDSGNFWQDEISIIIVTFLMVYNLIETENPRRKFHGFQWFILHYSDLFLLSCFET